MRHPKRGIGWGIAGNIRNMNIVFGFLIGLILIVVGFVLGWSSKELQIRNLIFSLKRTAIGDRETIWNAALERVIYFLNKSL